MVYLSFQLWMLGKDPIEYLQSAFRDDRSNRARKFLIFFGGAMCLEDWQQVLQLTATSESRTENLSRNPRIHRLNLSCQGIH